MIRTTLLALVALAAAPAIAQPARAPVVVELFQSQGCSSCPPANAYVNAIAGRADVLALSFAVTYWDQLGWKDRFARAAYTDRQWDYAHARALPDVATPELIVNGRHGARGSDRRALDGALAAGAKDAPAISVSIGADGVTVGAGAVSGADVWLVRYDPRVLEVPITRGENGGRTLPHRNIVKQLVRLGQYRGTSAHFALPPAPEAGLLTAALVQTPHGGPILAAAKG